MNEKIRMYFYSFLLMINNKKYVWNKFQKRNDYKKENIKKIINGSKLMSDINWIWDIS